jgi:hypothetical protein
MYRSWRDVGVRGFTADGLPDRSFRGRYASRNAAFTDLLILWGPKTTVRSRGLRILVQDAAESITSEDPDVVAGDRVGQRPQRRGLP